MLAFLESDWEEEIHRLKTQKATLISERGV
jgi:hypothetical protein